MKAVNTMMQPAFVSGKRPEHSGQPEKSRPRSSQGLVALSHAPNDSLMICLSSACAAIMQDTKQMH
jgi:hypothetical protein